MLWLNIKISQFVDKSQYCTGWTTVLIHRHIFALKQFFRQTMTTTKDLELLFFLNVNDVHFLAVTDSRQFKNVATSSADIKLHLPTILLSGII